MIYEYSLKEVREATTSSGISSRKCDFGIVKIFEALRWHTFDDHRDHVEISKQVMDDMKRKFGGDWHAIAQFNRIPQNYFVSKWLAVSQKDFNLILYDGPKPDVIDAPVTICQAKLSQTEPQASLVRQTSAAAFLTSSITLSKPSPSVPTAPPLENLDNTCVVCLTNERSTVIFPCRHLVLCRTCSFQIDQCPLCRGPIDNFLKVFM